MEAPRLELALDASAVIALFRNEPSAPQVETLLRNGHGRIATVTAAETVDVLVRVYGWDADDVVAGVEQLLSTAAESVRPSLEVSLRAGELRARHFRRDQRVSLADCFVIATARPGDTVVTGDTTLASIAEAEGIPVIGLV